MITKKKKIKIHQQLLLFLKRARKRAKKSIRRKNRKSFHKIRPYKITSPLLIYLSENNFINEPQEKIHSKCTIKMPRYFSFLENPDESLETIGKIVKYVTSPKLTSLQIDHRESIKLDLGASTVMDVIIMDAKSEWERWNRDIDLGGNYSIDPKVNEILKVTGLLKHINHRDSNEESLKKKYSVFNLEIGLKETQSSKRSSKAERVITELTNYFNNLLRKFSYELSETGKNKMSKLLGEIIDNAEQHSTTFKWYVIGYMDDAGVCSICLFNFGEPISRRLKNSDLNINIMSNIEQLISHHRIIGSFKSKEKWNEDDLWTLVALQEGISRYNIKDDDSQRGNGTVEMIRFFMSLSDKNSTKLKPQMVLISGNTYILFDGKYDLVNKKFGDEERKIISFNNENDLFVAPDNNYVKSLKNFFPGTIISMKFCLDKKVLDKIYGGKYEHINN